jgi:hypothetical protein
MDDTPVSVRATIIEQLWQSAARQVADIHARVLAAGLAADERERDARMLSVVVKTLRDLAALDDTLGTGHDERTDDADSRDIDEFRRELARRIDALATAPSGAADGDASSA